MPSISLPASGAVLPKRSHVALCGAAAAASLTIPQAAAADRPRKQRVARARQVAIYLAHVGFSLTYTHLGEAFGRDRTTIRHACGRIEDARDEYGFDRALDFLENALRLHATRALGVGDAQ
jgi:chromosomal replication initiation ATPase DnaA